MENNKEIFPISTSYPAKRMTWHNSPENIPCISEDTLNLAEEVPLSLAYNGLDYAVMMITPHNITDFVIGFSLTEGLVQSPSDIKLLSVTSAAGGLRADIRVGAEALRTVLARTRRPIAGRTGCGICGSDMDSLLQRGKKSITGYTPEFSAIRSAVMNLRQHQTLNAGIGMLHAAAWCTVNGQITFTREDVGRHNALDKLIGYGLNNNYDFTNGFCLLTSRCSYEMATKAITAGMSALVSLSAPTALALRTAQQAGLVLVAPVKPDHLCIFSPTTPNSDLATSNNSAPQQNQHVQITEL